MHVCTVRGTEIRVHPLMLVVVAGACVLGRLYELLQAALALSLHEAGHAAAAAAFGSRMLSIEWMPFGGVARMTQSELSPHAEWCVALTGPVTSFFLAGAVAILSDLAPMTGARMQPFLTANLMLGLVNLLPALPLDGGRVAKCALSGPIGLQAATKLTAWTGVAAGSGMLAAAVFAAINDRYNLTLPVLGLFLLLAAAGELRLLPEKRLATLLRHGEDVRTGGLTVREVAARRGMPAREALRLMRASTYNVIRVLDDDLSTAGELDEQALIVGMVRHGSAVSVGKLMELRRLERRFETESGI